MHVHSSIPLAIPSARMCSEGSPVCVCVSVFPWPSSATDATKQQSRHTGGLSIVFASISIWRFSYNGYVAIAFPYLHMSAW